MQVKPKIAAGCIGLILIAFVAVEYLVPALLRTWTIDAFEKTHQAQTLEIERADFSFWGNRITFNSIVISAIDSSFSCILDSISISGIRWIQLVLANPIASLSGLHLEGRNIVVSLRRSGYELSCSGIQASVRDSEMVL